MLSGAPLLNGPGNLTDLGYTVVCVCCVVLVPFSNTHPILTIVNRTMCGVVCAWQYYLPRRADLRWGRMAVPSSILQDEHRVPLVRGRTLNTKVRARITNLVIHGRLHQGGVSLVVECQIPATTAFVISEV